MIPTPISFWPFISHSWLIPSPSHQIDCCVVVILHPLCHPSSTSRVSPFDAASSSRPHAYPLIHWIDCCILLLFVVLCRPWCCTSSSLRHHILLGHNNKSDCPCHLFCLWYPSCLSSWLLFTGRSSSFLLSLWRYPSFIKLIVVQSTHRYPSHVLIISFLTS